MRVAALTLLFLCIMHHLDTVDGVPCKTPYGAPSLISACDCTATAITCNNKGLLAMPANLTNCTQFAPKGILSIFFVRVFPRIAVEKDARVHLPLALPSLPPLPTSRHSVLLFVSLYRPPPPTTTHARVAVTSCFRPTPLRPSLAMFDCRATT